MDSVLLRGAAVVGLLVAMVCAVEALADPTVGVYFDEAGTQQTLELGSSELDVHFVSLYVVVHGVDDRAEGFDAGILIPESANVWSVSPLGDSLDGCNGPPWTLEDMHCRGNCQFSAGPPQRLMYLLVEIPSTSSDFVIRVVPPSSPGYFGGDGGLSIFTCSSGDVPLSPAQSPYGPGAAAINPTDAVRATDSSWGRIKSLY